MNLTPAELKAIENHRKKMVKEQTRIVTFDEALQDFVKNCYERFKKEKLQQDNKDQLHEIDVYKWCEGVRTKSDPGEKAMMDWVIKNAKKWREERESLKHNGGATIQITITDPNGLHMRPSSAIASIARNHGCNIYVHRIGEPFPVNDFSLDGKDYVNVESFLTFMLLGIIQGNTIEFLATGDGAQEAALEDIKKAIENGCNG